MFDLVIDPRARNSLLQEIRCEFLRLWRSPSFIVPTLLFPGMFYVLFGVILTMSKSFQAAHYMMASYCVFGVIAPGLFGFGVTVALEREKGLLALKRALPMPPANYLLAKLATAIAFALVIYLELCVLGATLGGVRLEAAQWLQLSLVPLLGVLPFCALGLLVGCLTTGQGAPAVGNLIYLPLAFLSGLWIPLFALPKVFQMLAPLWPAWHLGQLAQAAIGQPHTGTVFEHVTYLAGFTAILFYFAQRRLARVG
ncbi:ABC transporter permease [Tahibacter amnicola]|uniref:ABC transporter permease n=1 Tax=Tahibacter amnicola TaxID=2976241 RepID=A0ABY6BI52_9GAMM|nr:ABC transporter permease [Tahibacter amnicola]UXI69539.1 ABC transporter permease [Tahibacter amnicola]